MPFLTLETAILFLKDLNIDFLLILIFFLNVVERSLLLYDFSNCSCKQENVEPDALKEWKINIFKTIDTRITFNSRNTHLLPPSLNLLFVILGGGGGGILGRRLETEWHKL